MGVVISPAFMHRVATTEGLMKATAMKAHAAYSTVEAMATTTGSDKMQGLIQRASRHGRRGTCRRTYDCRRRGNNSKTIHDTLLPRDIWALDRAK